MFIISMVQENLNALVILSMHMKYIIDTRGFSHKWSAKLRTTVAHENIYKNKHIHVRNFILHFTIVVKCLCFVFIV
jgi:hypothetical protein